MSNFNQVCPGGCIAEVTHPNPPEPAEDATCEFCGDYLEDCSCAEGALLRGTRDGIV